MGQVFENQVFRNICLKHLFYIILCYGHRYLVITGLQFPPRANGMPVLPGILFLVGEMVK